MDTIDAFMVLPVRPRPGFRTAWLFQRREYAAAALVRADTVFRHRQSRSSREVRRLPSHTHAVKVVRVCDILEEVDSIDFVPAFALVRGGFHGMGRGASHEWYNARVMADAVAAERLRSLQYRQSQLLQVAIFDWQA